MKRNNTYAASMQKELWFVCYIHNTVIFKFQKKILWLVQYIESTTILYSTLQTAHLYTTHNNMMYTLRRRHHDLHSTQKTLWFIHYLEGALM